MRTAVALAFTMIVTAAIAQEARELRAGRGDASGQCSVLSSSVFRTATGRFKSNAVDRYVEVDGTRVEFEAGDRGCAIIMFSAEVYIPDTLYVTVIVDNKVSLPGPVFFGDPSAQDSDARSFTFVVPNLSPGKHTAWVEAKTFDCCIEVGYRTLVVQHP